LTSGERVGYGVAAEEAVKKDNLAYLLGGVALGFVVGYATFHTVANRPGIRRADGAGGREPAAVIGSA